MASDTLPSSSASTVSLFQKAHGRMTTLQRIDEQVAALQEQRRKIQEELRAVQGLINEEFDRVVKGALPETPNRMLSHMAEAAKASSNGNASASRADFADAAA